MNNLTRRKPNVVLPKGPGRPKGVPNKLPALLKEAVVTAATQAGGKEGLEGFLTKQAMKENNAPFMALLGKVLPMQVAGDPDNPIAHEIVIRVVRPE